MALYWHPFLAELLRHDYGDRLIVEEEVVLGDMPLKADLLLIRRDPTVALPFPFDLLGERTLDVSRKYGVSPARVSQKRREFHAAWLAFHGDDVSPARCSGPV